MKFLFMGMLAFVLSFPVVGNAKESEKPVVGPLKVLKTPIDMKYGDIPQLAVVFNHSSHKNIKCVQCHHEALSRREPYAPCTSEGCHSIPGARERGVDSMFMAYHDPDTTRSCYGCHKKEASRYPQFVGCRPCHVSPIAKGSVATK